MRAPRPGKRGRRHVPLWRGRGDAVHMAFAPHDDGRPGAVRVDPRATRGRRARLPRHLLAVGSALVRRVRRREDEARRVGRPSNVSSATCWLEMTVDGATHAWTPASRDTSWSALRPIGNKRGWTRRSAGASPDESSRAERGIRGGVTKAPDDGWTDVKSRERRRDFRGDPGDVGATTLEPPELDVSELGVPALDEHGSFGFFEEKGTTTAVRSGSRRALLNRRPDRRASTAEPYRRTTPTYRAFR